ncbi:hypothetical protein [Arthrobacter sp. UYCo732]|uniref:hypothetical protein n=1 Tax=Arthrobacter sp. UYCo732 TaxID=3156336 RepID=UPI003391F65C
MALDALQTNNIHGLNVVQIVSAKTASLVHKSAEADKAAEALAQQEPAAKAERERLAGEASTKLSTAQTAQQAMSQQVAEQQEHSTELTAQPASLRGTTGAVEGEFRQGQARLAANGWAQDQFQCLAQLWTKESNWLTTATNPYSGLTASRRRCRPASTRALAATGSPVTEPRLNGEWLTLQTVTGHCAPPGTIP